jgi:ion channel-forming bestrophin family protein
VIDYDPHQWRTTFFAVKGSMLRAILARVSIAMAFAFGITAVHYWVYPMSIPEASTAHGLVGPALGLLLVFRTNSSYDRWWEGRKLWGSIVNTSRNLARGVTVQLAMDPERVTRILKLTAAWPYSAKEQLRLQPHVTQGCDPRDEESLRDAQHLPTAIARRITFLLDEARRQGKLTDIQFTDLDDNNQILVDCIGACERIHKTPLPFAYVVHLRRAMVLFCGTLPFALLARFGPWSIVITLIVSYIMFGIEEIGVEIEDPFEIDDNDLPLDRICDGIKANVLAFLPAEAAK